MNIVLIEPISYPYLFCKTGTTRPYLKIFVFMTSCGAWEELNWDSERVRRAIPHQTDKIWNKTHLMSGLDVLFWVFSVGDLGSWSPSVDPALLDLLFICGRKTSSVPLRNLWRSLQEGATDGNQLVLGLGFSSSGLGFAPGMLSRTSLLSIIDVGTDVGRSCCQTWALQSSLSCFSDFMMMWMCVSVDSSVVWSILTRSTGHS